MGCAIRSNDRRWVSGIIPYVIHPEVTGLVPIYAAMAFWESNTNVRFVRRYLQSDYIEFVLDAGALGASYASVGRIGGRQVVASSNSFDTRAYLHELGHSLGLFHEQQRSDRDEFVSINIENVQDGKEHNFTKESDSKNSDDYDYRSIMHYNAFAFAKDSSIPVITPLDTNIDPSVLGSSAVPTAQDIAMVNSMYPKLGPVRRSSSQNGAGEAKEISSLVVDNSRLVTAVMTGNNKLKMILWTVDSLGGIVRRSPVNDANTAGDASFISCAQAGDNIVAAMRNGGGNLYLISWQFENGQLVRKADSGTLAGAATFVKVINLTNSVLLTACRTGSGDLKLIAWRVSSTGQFTRLGDSGSQAGAVSEISMIRFRTFNNEHIVATAVRAGNGAVKVITWGIAVSNNAATISRRGDSGSDIGEGSQIQTAISPFNHLIVSCRSGSGDLVLISLAISPSGREIRREYDTHSMAGEIGVNSLVTRPYGVVSGVSDGNGNLKLIKWVVNSSGQFTRSGDSSSQAGEIGSISMKSFASKPEAPLCTSVRDGSGKLFLISWDDESQSGELRR